MKTGLQNVKKILRWEETEKLTNYINLIKRRQGCATENQSLSY